jgi:DNA-binding transcriptional regulator GbsR (MarR family)
MERFSMKIVKLLFFTFIVLLNGFMVYARPCAPLARRAGQEATKKLTDRGEKVYVSIPRTGVISSTKKIYPFTSTRSSISARHAFDIPDTTSKLRKKYQKLQDDLNKLKSLLSKYEEKQKELQQLNKELKHLYKLKNPEKEDAEIKTSKIPIIDQLKNIQKEKPEIRY